MSVQKKRKRRHPSRFLHVLLLIVAVLVIFEGQLLVNIFSRESIQNQVKSQLSELFAENTEAETAPPESEKNSESTSETTAADSGETDSADNASSPQEELVGDWVVKEQPVAVDDSYFDDATFIGDSRLMGFQNQSGITSGHFITSVGMNAADIFDSASIASAEGNITVFQALYATYQTDRKFYVLLGTNDLGNLWGDASEFTNSFRVMLGELKKFVRSDAIIYVMSIPYVEESKVTTGDYISNANVDIANEILQNLCKENGYYYINLNEVLSDGNHSLIPGASSDGVHMYEKYCKIMLDYLRTHYIPEDEMPSVSEEESEQESTSETTETSTEISAETSSEAS